MNRQIIAVPSNSGSMAWVFFCLFEVTRGAIKKGLFIVSLWGCIVAPLFAQQDALLAADDKLKVLAAQAAGLDTLPEFRLKLKAFSENLRLGAFSEEFDEVSFRSELQQPQLLKRFLVMQIYKSVPQHCSKAELDKTNSFMQQLYEQLLADPRIDFASYVEAYSDTKGCLDIGWMEYPLEVERTVFAMRKGEISAPFSSPQGSHIVKLLDIKDLSLSEELKKEWQLRSKRRYLSGKENSFVKHLKATHRFTPNQQGVNELFQLGNTGKILFTLQGKEYTGDDFRFFSEANPKGIHRQFDDFVVKSLFDLERDHRVAKTHASNQSIEDYRDALLISAITQKEVTSKAQSDKAGLSAYFSVNKKHYRWPHPRFQGVVLHTSDKKIQSEIKKLLKKKPVAEWQKFINEVYNTGVVQLVVEQGLFKEGDNPYVDALVFKKGRVVPLSSHPFTSVVGKKIKGPESYLDAPQWLITDYEKFLEAQWLKHLRQTYRVEINK